MKRNLVLNEGEGMETDRAERVGNVSYYPVKSSKLPVGGAFYYQIPGREKKRATVTGKDEAEVDRKIEAYLSRKTREHCEEMERQRKAEEEKNKPLEFAQVGERWFADYLESKEMSFSIKDCRRENLKKLNGEIGEMPIDRIDDEEAKNLIDRCSKKIDGYYSKSYVDKLQQTFRMVMEYGVKKGYCKRVPDKVKLSDKLTVPDKDERYLDDNQLREVLKALKDNPKYSTLVNVLLSTGMRQEEALALKMDDFKILKDGMAEIAIYKTVVETEKYTYDVVMRTKTKGSRRKISIPRKVYEVVKEYYEDCVNSETPEQRRARHEKGYDGYIFLNSNMEPFNKRALERNFSDYLKRHGIGFRVTLHMFRHTFVSNLAETVPLDKVAKVIGDSLAITSEIYQSLSDRTKETICDSILEKYEELNRGEE